SGAGALRREGRLRDAADGARRGRGHQEGREAIGDPHLPQRGSRVLQRGQQGRLQQGRRRRRLAPHDHLLPPEPQVARHLGGPAAVTAGPPSLSARDTPVIKSISLLTRKDGWTHEQFVRHWVDAALFIGRIKTYTVEEQQVIPTSP